MFDYFGNKKINLNEITKSINKPLAQIENRYQFFVKSDDPFIQKMIDYVFQKKGKRIRPTLVFLSSKINESTNYQAICDLALAIELIHTATLIHDDVNDKSNIRRGVKTYNKKYGPTFSILFGDFLFSKSFVILTNLNNMEIINNLSKTTSEICQGEIMQNINQNNLALSIKNYLNIIRYKTASLIGESCRVGTTISKKNKALEKSLYEFGINIGMAFQIYDDYLDFNGKIKELGKPILNDLMNGYFTLPIIYLLEQNTNGNKQKILEQINKSQKNNNLDEIKSILKKFNCLNLTLQMAKKYVDQAINNLDKIKDNELKVILKQLALYIIQREK